VGATALDAPSCAILPGAMRRLLAVLPIAVLALLLVSPASADAALKHCHKVTKRVGGSPVTWTAHHIRLSHGFKCKDARSNIRTWIGYGGMMDNPRALAPWRCNFGGDRNRCRLRTSFGGTRPLRTYRLRFRLRN
jgi:hypothetical protein